jgi:PAT family beta-lactamase induction signal transducer AmpG
MYDLGMRAGSALIPLVEIKRDAKRLLCILKSMTTNSVKDFPASAGAAGRVMSPWSFIPTLYFPLGMMGVLSVWQVMQLFKLLGYPNYIVSLISGLGFLGAFRFLYAPWLDGLASKRTLSLFCTGLTVALYIIIGFIFGLCPPGKFLMWILIPALVLLALVSSAYETAVDGFYIRALDEKLQAEFIGIKTAGYRVGNILVAAGLGWIFAKVASHYGAIRADSPDKTGFCMSAAGLYLISAVLTLGLLFWNRRQVPMLAHDQPVRHTRFALGEMLRDYFAQDSIGLICAFILLYRFGEGLFQGMMGNTGMIGPFCLDPLSKGGLGIPVSSGPLIGAISGMPMSIIGGILGGFIIKWLGLRRTFVPLALAMSLPNLASVFLAIFQPQAHFMLFGEQIFTWLILSSAIENFSYGMSFSAISYYIFVMASESGRNKTSILAVSSALQYVGYFLPMMLSGAVQSLVGYVGVFITSVVMGLPAVFIIPHLPMPLCECGKTPAPGKVQPASGLVGSDKKPVQS